MTVPAHPSAPDFLAQTGRRERNPLWILLWLLSASVAAFLLTVPIGLGMALFASELAPTLTELEPFPETPNRLRLELALMGLLSASLVAAAGGALFAAWAVFRRSVPSFVSPARRFEPALVVVGALVFGVLVVGAILLESGLRGEPLEPPLLKALYPVSDRLAYGLAAVPLLLLAAAAEEVVFRGVLLQITGAFTRNPAILVLINAVLFSAAHLEFDPAPFLARVGLGAAFAWTVLKLGGLEFAIGAHTANNLMLTWFSAPLSDSTDPEREVSMVYAGFDVALSAAMVGLVLLLARHPAVRRWIAAPRPVNAPAPAA